MKKLIFVLALFLAACGSNEETEPIVEDNVEESEQNVMSWDEQIKHLATNEDMAADKYSALERYMMEYESTSEEVAQFKSDILSEYKAGTYLNEITNHEFMLANIFKSYVVEQNSDGALKDFAFDYFQNMKYTYRGVDAVDSEAVKSNESQMDESLTEIK